MGIISEEKITTGELETEDHEPSQFAEEEPEYHIDRCLEYLLEAVEALDEHHPEGAAQRLADAAISIRIARSLCLKPR